MTHKGFTRSSGEEITYHVFSSMQDSCIMLEEIMTLLLSLFKD